MAVIYTIGHSNVPVQKLIDLLMGHGIEVVVDVRSEPYSKYASQFNKREIEPELRENGFDYIYLGNKLGGKPKSPGFLTPGGVPDYEKMAESPLFKAGIEEVEQLAGEKKTSLMCSEADPKSCHRDRLLAWVLRGRGHTVSHILHDGSIATDEQGVLL
ncbi:MAG: DUF488 domain-containing protein [Armatimonadota bacterium]